MVPDLTLILARRMARGRYAPPAMVSHAAPGLIGPPARRLAPFLAQLEGPSLSPPLAGLPSAAGMNPWVSGIVGRGGGYRF